MNHRSTQPGAAVRRIALALTLAGLHWIGIPGTLARSPAAPLANGITPTGWGAFSTFTQTVGTGSDATWAVAPADFDGDGDIDIAVGNFNAQNVLYLNDGTGAFTATLNFGTGSDATKFLAWADFDGDADLDLAVGNEGGQNVVYINGGAGAFTGTVDFGTGSDPTRGLAWGDFDGDGDLDLAVGNNSGQSAVYPNDGAGGFGTPINIGGAADITEAIIWGDFDKDGDLDIAIAVYNGPDAIFFNDGAGTFGSPLLFDTGASDSSQQLAWGDFDADGDPDLAVANLNVFWGGQSMVFLNKGDGTLGARILLGNPTDASTSVAWGDFNGDGAPDLVVGNDAKPNVIYTNAQPPSIQARRPAANAQSAPLSSRVVVTYNAPLIAETVTSRTLAVHGMMGGFVTATHGVNGRVISVTPTHAFLPGEPVFVSASDRMLDITGTRVLPAVWQFNAAAPAGWGYLNVVGEPIGAGSKYAKSVAWADFDGDGDPDLAVGRSPGQNVVYPNNGDGTFGTPINIGAPNQNTMSVAWGDYDGDGDPDLAVANFVRTSMLYPNDGAGGFGAPIALFGGAQPIATLSWGDFNGDGHLDLATGRAHSGNYLYFGDGTGNFSTALDLGAGYVIDIDWGDFDNDGALDLALAVFFGQSRIVVNNGAGGVASTVNFGPSRSRAYAVDWADYDGDGDLDLAAGSKDGQSVVHLNNGDGTFGLAVPFGPSNAKTNSLAWGDVDADGDLDLAVGNSNEQNTLYLNNGGDLAAAGQSFATNFGTGGNTTVKVAWADADGDGDLDLAAGNSGESMLYLNVPDPSLSSLTLSPGTLRPSFDPTTLNYTVKLPYATTSVVVTATTVDSSATLSYGACAGGVCALQPGVNVFTLTTTARDGVTTADYVLTIERELLAAHSPAANAVAVPPTSSIALTYAVALDATTATSRTIVVQGAQSGKAAASPVVAGNKVTFAPARAFLPGEMVRASVSQVTDITGTRVLPTGWQFHAAVGDGWGRFAPAAVGVNAGSTHSKTNAIAWGDFNGDRALDMVVANYYQQSYVYLSDGAGGFGSGIPLNNTDGGQAVATGDFDADGDVDIAFGTDCDESLIYVNDGAGAFTPGPTIGDSDCNLSWAVGDVNGDGSLDLVSGGYDNGWVNLNNGDGTFAASIVVGDTGVDFPSVALGDVDGDGDLDLAMGADGGQSMLYPNRGDGTFGVGAPFGGSDDSIYAHALAWGDFDKDGDLDLAAGVFGGQSMVYPNDGAGNLGAGVPFGGSADNTTSVAWGDFDKDGDLDLAASVRGSQSMVHLNDGAGGFGAAIPFGSGSDRTLAVAWGDANGDGALDLALGNYQRTSMVYLNEPPDTRLQSLVLSAGTLTPAFVSTTTAYTAAVPNAAASIVVTGTPRDISATVAYGGCTGNTCALSVGVNLLTVTVSNVTAANVTVTKLYTLAVTRAAAVPTPTPTPTNTPVPSNTSTNTPIPSNTSTNTPVPSNTSTNTPVPSNTPVGTPVPTPTPTPTNTPVPSNTSTNTPVPSNTPAATATATATPATACSSVVTSLADSGAGSLRAAVACASAGSTITFAPATFSVPRTITLAAQIPITRSLVISGPGSSLLTISGAGVTRTLYIDAGAANDVRLFGLTLSRGRAIADNGGAIYVQTARSLTISDTRIVDNAAPGAQGGGLYVLGSLPLILVDSQVVSNTAGTDCGGFCTNGSVTLHNSQVLANSALNYGGFYAGGVVAMTSSQVSSNTARQDYGGFYAGGALTMTDSQVTSNTTRYSVGGFWANSVLMMSGSRVSSNTAGRGVGGLRANSAMTMTDSQVTSNTAGTDYGGVYALGSASITNSYIGANAAGNRSGGAWLAGAAAVANSTIASNTAGVGAGIVAEASIRLSNSTIAGNTAITQGGGIFLQSGSVAGFLNVSVVSNRAASAAGIAFNSAGPHTFTNTIVGGAAADQCAGTSTKRSFSSISNDADCGLRSVASVGVGLLGDYGGEQPTAPLAAGSPALDAGDPAACPATDQRGFARVGVCDIGAYESRGFTMVLQSGAVQTTTTNSAFPAPLVVRFFSNSGEPLGPGGLLSVTSAGISPAAASVRVDTRGWATVPLTAGVSSGVYPITITAAGVAAPVIGRLTNLAPGQPTPTPTRTRTATATPAPTSTPATPTPTPTPSAFVPYVSPNYGPVTTSTVSIIGPAGSNFTSATGVYVNGVRMIHVVRNDQRVEFTMQPGLPGAAVDVVLVKAGGSITFPLAYTFEATTIRTLNPNTGAVLTTTTGVTVSVSPQAALRADSPEIAGTLVLTFAHIDAPADAPGDVPLSFFDFRVDIDGVPAAVLSSTAVLELSVVRSTIPAGQQPWLYEWIADPASLPSAGRWQLVTRQSYDSLSGVVTAHTSHPGTYSVVTAARKQLWFPIVRLK